MKSSRNLCLCVSAHVLAWTIIAASPTFAQETGPAQQETAAEGEVPAGEIVVTAQRREQRLLDVPVAVSAISGETLQSVGVRQATDVVKLVPGLTFLNAGPVSLFSVRGITLNDYGDSNESPIAFYADDVYIAALAATTGQMFDIERVEVLRGPQGTLFGRNATGGLIQVISRKPTRDFSANVSLQYGSYDQVIVEAGIGGPITDGIRFRTSGTFNRDDGWQRNLTTGTRLAKTHAWALRQLVDIELASNLKATLNVHGGRTDNTVAGYGFRGTLDPNDLSSSCSETDIVARRCVNAEGFRDPNPDPRHVYSDRAAPKSRVRNFGTSATLRWTLGDVDVTSVTAYERTKKSHQEDADASPQQLFSVDYNADRKQFSQELRANGTSGNLTWVLGAYYFNEKLDDGLVSVPTLVPFLGTYGLQNQYRQRSESGAAFAQLDYELVEGLTATAGIRYSTETKKLTISDDFANPFYINNERAHTEKITWKAGLNWKLAPDWMTYASVSTGFKSPAFNTTLSLDGGSRPAAPETNTNFEIGVKGQSADRRFQISTAAFYTKYRNFQLVDIPDDASVPSSVLLNADGARILGAEVELNARPIQGLTLNASATYLDTKIQSPGLQLGNDLLDGNRLTRSPRWSLKGLAMYEIDAGSAGRFGVRVDGSYQTAADSQLNNGIAARTPSYALANGGLSWSPADSNFTFEAFVDNIFDKAYTTHQYILVDANALQWGRPRTWGARVSAKW
ncbi:TonB-dependent receptor [Sphingobium chlorophenolicum L-1]|uniref:TonB-dependent receptor n=1 Tax=Sphingobium chlorophenolicum L-1 TaxID=690566 RepID=F6EWY9_SPHCR|nr:TonB-dependent receptor [Sphingobium chlorophenolicum]AEG48152.1 TonB-dependent receptor [Sphingobium chlorophenolicum L-1]